MKNKFFSVGMFREYFRQLKIIGIIGTALYILIGIFVPVGANLGEGYTVRIPFEGLVWVQILIPLVFVPLLMLTAFHFLTKRSSSDFYHALPVKRGAMYTGILAAVLLWTVIMIIIPVMVMWTVCAPMKHVEMDFGETMAAVLNTFVSSLFMMGVFSLGINLSGMLFTNIIVSLIVLLLPRLIILMGILISDGLIKNFVSEFSEYGFFVRGNPLTKIIYCSVAAYGDDIKDIYFTGLLTGALEGAAYFFIGGVFFKRRKSEAASAPSLNRCVQSVIRHVLALIFSTVASASVIFCIQNDWEEGVVFVAVLFYVLSVVVYFLYELITTRRWRSVARSVRQLPLLLGLTAAAFIGMSVIAFRANSYRMDPEGGEHMEIIGTVGMYEYESLFDNLEFPVEIKSAELRKSIAEEYNMDMDQQKYDYYGQVAVSVGEGMFARRRHVYLGKDIFYKVLNEIYKGIDIQEKLPEFNKGKNELYMTWNGRSPCNWSYDDTVRIYSALREEIIGSDDMLRAIIDFGGANICTITLNGEDAAEALRLNVNQHTPRTFRLIQDIVKERQADSFADAAKELLSGGDIEILGNISVLAGDETCSSYFYWYDGDEDNNIDLLMNIYEIIKKYEPYGDVNGKNVFIENMAVSRYLNGGEETNFRATFGVYNLSDSDMKEMRRIIELEMG